MRRSLRVGVSRVAVVNGTGQWVQLLQGYSESHPHVWGDQVSAGHAERTEKWEQKTQLDFTHVPTYIPDITISEKASSHPLSAIYDGKGSDQEVPSREYIIPENLTLVFVSVFQ